MTGVGISNSEIEKIIKNSGNDDLGVFLLNKINNFIYFHGMMEDKKEVKYPFLNLNMDQLGKSGTRECEIFDIHPKREIFLFDTFGAFGLKSFIVQEDRKSIKNY